MAESKMVKFNNGQLYPTLGLGTWQASRDLDENAKNSVCQAIKSAIDIGYRHFDCAYYYNIEKEVGKAIAEKIEEGIIKRDDIFITSKLWNDQHRPELVEVTLKNTLNDLGLSYIDLYLIHWPFAVSENPNATDSEGRLLGSDISYTDTWKAMEQCVTKGLVKSIGLSNFNIKQIKDILEIASIKPVVNQVESHPYLIQRKLKEFCDSHCIYLIAYGPLGSPHRSWAASDEHVVLNEPVVAEIAANHNKKKAQILIKFQIQRGLLVIPKSGNPERQKLNFDVWDFELSKDEIELLESLDRNIRYYKFETASHLKDYPFHDEA
ncbi:1,5-anhydro-D-fructose reductase-like [Daktulosphaira vitifoliae]|uniref:1,5-anhydro-D-fructose reductase-like n=1 Tax=Daktulosphaira vitifoliae TaxID=58002 RepID=UPI0021A9BA30|nr:1,5-anhydro-D-fructose reductase-like [Daktulosphaira vitifoliae]